MIHRIEHALVMDTDDIPGRGGYAVVGLSAGLTQAERVFVAENFGISDYLHDPQNDRAFYSFFRVPGGRFAFVRRFSKGLRRSGSQNRVFIHTMFLEDETFRALHGLPWLLVESKFRRGTSAWQPLTLDYGPLIDSADFAALEWEPQPEVIDDPARRLQSRLGVVGKRLAGVDPIDAIGSVLAALQQDVRAVLPQGSIYELLTMLAWSMLPIADRMSLAWTQHDSKNVAVRFAVSNATDGSFTPAANAVARRIVAMNTNSEEWREFHTRSERYGLTIRGDSIEAWLRWHDALLAIGGADFDDLRRLAQTARPNGRDPWIDGQELLQMLWPRDGAVEKLGLRFARSGLGAVIFREPPAREWLDGVAAEPFLRFFLSATGEEKETAAARAAVAQWIVDHRVEVAADALAPLAVRLAPDRPPLLAPLLEHLLADPKGLDELRNATPLRPDMGDMVLLASILALQVKHPNVDGYVRGTLLAHLALPTDTRRKVNENIADAVAEIVRDDADTFARFVALLEPELQARLTEQVLERLRSGPEPLARDIVRRLSAGEYPETRHTLPLAFAVAAAGDPAIVWAEVVLRKASEIDGRADETITRRFAGWLDQLRGMDVDFVGLHEALLPHLQYIAHRRMRAGGCLRALVELAQPAWRPSIVAAVRDVLQATTLGSARAWDQLVSALARNANASLAEVSRMLLAFWTHVDPKDIAEVDEALIATSRRIDGEPRAEVVGHWTPRLRQLPEGPRAEAFLALIRELSAGKSLEVRIAERRRAIDQEKATHETLNALDEDLWDRNPQRHGQEMAAVVTDYAAMTTNGRMPAPAARVRRLIDALVDPGVQPAVKWAIEQQMALELSRLSTGDWNQIVRLPPENLERSGSFLMTMSRQLGGSRAAEAIDDFEETCRRMEWRDALDGLAAGRLAAQGRVAKMWKRVTRW